MGYLKIINPEVGSLGLNVKVHLPARVKLYPKAG
jgi:hypothetical protein